MSESYDVDGVTVTPQAGGYYQLQHPSMVDAERVRGKENADNRAKEIAAAAANPEGTMEAQPPLEQVIPDEQPDELSALKALVAQQNAQIEKLLALQATTVNTTGEPAPTPDPLAAFPTEFNGKASPEDKKLAKAVGTKYVTIILEEGNDIPPTGLFLGHNFRSYMIRPGEPVDVPEFLLGVLDDAIMSSPIVDPKTQKVLGYRNRMKYPYRRV